MPACKRVTDLEPGDLIRLSEPCACSEPEAPWRVEKLMPYRGGDLTDMTASHPPCGRTGTALLLEADLSLEFCGRENRI
jgi:hypothetical protein